MGNNAECPSYIPQNARKHLLKLIDSLEHDIEIKDQLMYMRKGGFSGLKAQLDVLYRIKDDPRMESVWKSPQVLKDSVSFLMCIIHKEDFNKLREDFQEAKRIVSEIEKLSRQLASYLNNPVIWNLDTPFEFSDIRSLLYQAESRSKFENSQLWNWQDAKHLILGFENIDAIKILDVRSLSPIFDVVHSVHSGALVDYSEMAKNHIYDCWYNAPSLSNCLMVIAEAAKHYTPELDDLTAEVTKTRNDADSGAAVARAYRKAALTFWAASVCVRFVVIDACFIHPHA